MTISLSAELSSFGKKSVSALLKRRAERQHPHLGGTGVGPHPGKAWLREQSQTEEPPRGPFSHQFLQHLYQEPRAWKKGPRAWKGGCVSLRCLEGLLPDAVRGPELSDTDTVTICRRSPGTRHWLYILRITNNLHVTWCGTAGIESQASLTIKLTGLPTTHPVSPL